MKTITTKGIFKNHKINLYATVKELPIDRYHELGKLILQHSGIGDSPEDIPRHYESLSKYIAMDNKNAVLQELQNLHNNLYYSFMGIDINSYCFAVFVRDVDGEYYNDLSVSGSELMVKKLGEYGVTQGQVESITTDLKKKLIRNFLPSFLIDSQEAAQLT